MSCTWVVGPNTSVGQYSMEAPPCPAATNRQIVHAPLRGIGCNRHSLVAIASQKTQPSSPHAPTAQALSITAATTMFEAG